MRKCDDRLVLAALAILAIALAAGCAADHLVFTTYTKTGLDITAADGAPTEAVFGYKRFEGAIVPVDPDDPDAPLQAIYAGVCVENSWLKGLEIGQVFATGSAATNVAGSDTRSSDVQDFLECTK